jgi:hypothetical protein
MRAFYAIKQPRSGDEIEGTLSILANEKNAQRILNNNENRLLYVIQNTQVLRT